MARRLISMFVVAVMGFVMIGGLTAHAQDATPISGANTLPVTPDPSECIVQPLTADELRAYVSSPDATPAVTEPDAFTLPTGTPADQASRDAVTAVLRQTLACFNAGNYLAFFGLVSENYLLESQAAGEITEDVIAFFAQTPVPAAPESQTTLVAIRDVIVLDDGRIGALADTLFPDEMPNVQTDFFYFTDEDGTWKLDDIVEDLEGQFPPDGMATPVAS